MILQLFSALASLTGIVLVVTMGVIYIAVGECDIMYRMGEVATFAFLASFGLTVGSLMEYTDAVEDEDESV